MKNCTRCKNEREDELFRKHRTVCRVCEREISLQRYHKIYADPERAKHRASVVRKHRHNHPEQYLYLNAKRRAEKFNLEFTIQLSDVVIPATCPVLGIKLKVNKNGHRQWDNSPTIDRIDNSKGYTPDNIKVISWKANNIKGFGTIEDFEKILNYMKNN